MGFTESQINEFKEHAVEYKWMGDCVITPELISFTDLMYHFKWRILPSTHEDRLYFPIHRESSENPGTFFQCNAASNLTIALHRVNDRLWDRDRIHGGADLSRYNEMEITMHRFINESSKMSLNMIF